jgi:small conductance mechanosensitive channel
VRHFLVVFRAAAVLAVVIGIAASGPAGAQLALPSAAPTPSTGIRQDGIYFTAPIRVDGNEIFRIAAPLRADPAHLSLVQRQIYVETAIDEVLKSSGAGFLNSMTEYDPRTLRVKIVPGGDVAAIEVVDERHHDPLALVTVTSVDAAYNQESVTAVAAQWQSALQTALVHALDLRQPQERAENLRLVGRVAIALAIITLGLVAVLTLIGRRTKAVRAQVEAATDAVQAERSLVAEGQEGSTHHLRNRILSLAVSAVGPAQQLQALLAASAFVYALINLMWFAGVAWAFSLFPRTESLAQILTDDVLAVAITIVVTVFLDRVLDITINRIATFWSEGTFVSTEDRARQILRVPTISTAFRTMKSVVLIFLAGLTILTQIGVPIGSVVTIGGLAALALSFAAQSFVKDFVNGFLVLLEDQYVVGDYIGIASYSGIVENLSLRMVQIRDGGGDLVTIPHGTVSSVVNKSRNWSRIDYRVPVDPAADIPKALALLQSSIEELAADPEWQDAIRLPVELSGIELMSKDWVVLRIAVKTGPLRQFEGKRALNLRVEKAFKEAGIAFGAQLPPNYYT